jgi:colicin import membrane protein
MPAPATDRLRPWIGSAALHLILIGLLAGFAVKWRTEPPPPQLAIEGSVVRYEDLPSSVKSGKPLREKVPQPQPQPPVQAQPAPQPEPERKPDTAIAQQRAAEQQAKLAAERERAEQQAAVAERQREADAAKQAAARQTAAKQDAARKAAARQQEALQAQQREQLAQEQAARDAKLKAAREARLRSEREAELKRALASEEEGEAFQRSGVVDEYRTLLTQTVERNWIRPPSAKAGLECTLYVTQVPGGAVSDVKVGTCNGDEAVRQSVANAVYRSSPLPAPRDPRAFSRELVIVFKPTE